MESEETNNELKSLPRRTARPGFTGRVLERLDTPAPASHLPRVAAVAAACVIVGMLAIEGQRAREQRRNLEDLNQLRQELSQIRADLPAADDGVLLVGGTETTDYVIDLRPNRNATAPPSLESTFY